MRMSKKEREARSAGEDYAYDLMAWRLGATLAELEAEASSGCTDMMGDECAADFAYDECVKVLRKEFKGTL